MHDPDSTVLAFTDGAALGNPGPGGYGVVLKHRGVPKELSEGYRYTTNNRMELLGAIVALETLERPCRVMLATDSRYVVDGITIRVGLKPGGLTDGVEENERRQKIPISGAGC